jgi:hypothetical protein
MAISDERDVQRILSDVCPFEGCKGGLSDHWAVRPEIAARLGCEPAEIGCCQEHVRLLATMESAVSNPGLALE